MKQQQLVSHDSDGKDLRDLRHFCGDYTLPPIRNWTQMDYMEFLQIPIRQDNLITEAGGSETLYGFAVKHGDPLLLQKSILRVSKSKRICGGCGLYGHVRSKCRPTTVRLGVDKKGKVVKLRRDGSADG